MRIGIVADIHEAIEALQKALVLFREQGVDCVVNLGDACDIYGKTSRAGEVVDLLRSANAIGVWGNHDIGLCHEVSGRIASETDPKILSYMTTMRPFVVVEDCRFSHVDPWIDAMEAMNLWYFDGPPSTPQQVACSFDAVPERMVFVGHYHRWLVMNSRLKIEWDGSSPLELDPMEKYFVVVAPVVSGWCCIYDTSASRLIPLRCVSQE